MMARPLHQLGLSSLRCQHYGSGTSPAERAIPYVKLSLELPRRTGSVVTDTSLQCIKDKTAPLTMSCRHSSKLQDSSTPPLLAA